MTESRKPSGINPANEHSPPFQLIDSSGRENALPQYYKLFQYSPIPIWLEDFSEIKSYFDNLKKKGIRNLRGYFEKHPEEVLSLSRKVKIIEVNDAALELYEAQGKEEL
ncbi:MAG: hypothetical protein C4538_07010 [Nitrospiraceae bacterium]|nr:MAG: hypothetical protein C4538_07010 [Nitrospiraceae bacterium]